MKDSGQAREVIDVCDFPVRRTVYKYALLHLWRFGGTASQVVDELEIAKIIADARIGHEPLKHHAFPVELTEARWHLLNATGIRIKREVAKRLEIDSGPANMLLDTACVHRTGMTRIDRKTISRTLSRRA